MANIYELTVPDKGCTHEVKATTEINYRRMCNRKITQQRPEGYIHDTHQSFE